ncbi:MAG: flagellar export protein FliJ [Treponema sp.]|jgi:flagellar FliJ protein|nr:flagellar export protein FliJ [Treponema sp.]
MKRFRFSLDKVLKLRKYSEDEAKIALGQAVGILAAIENDIKENSIRRHNAALERFSDIGQIAWWDNYISRLDQMADKLAEDAARAQLVAEEKRVLYLEASRERKAIDKLKEKRQKEYRKETLDSQMSEMDDLTASRK